MVVVSTEALTFFFTNYDGVFGFHCRGVGSGHVMAEPDPNMAFSFVLSAVLRILIGFN
jgi:hypothetical protein